MNTKEKTPSAVCAVNYPGGAQQKGGESQIHACREDLTGFSHISDYHLHSSFRHQKQTLSGFTV